MAEPAEPFSGASGLQLARLLQLASPALPIGAYSYSSGLESALELGLVRDADSAWQWLADAVELVQGRFDAPIVAAACQCPVAAELSRLDDLVLAARETAELRLEAEQTGYSLGAWLAQVPELPRIGPPSFVDPACVIRSPGAHGPVVPLERLLCWRRGDPSQARRLERIGCADASRSEETSNVGSRA